MKIAAAVIHRFVKKIRRVVQFFLPPASLQNRNWTSLTADEKSCSVFSVSQKLSLGALS